MKIYSLLVIVLVLMISTAPVTKEFNVTLPEVTIIEYKTIYFNKNNLDKYPVEYILAGVAHHEQTSIKGDTLERWLIMEACYNRIIDNFANAGPTAKQQLLFKNQWTGLFRDRPETFMYGNKVTIANKDMAKRIIAGERKAPKRIYYTAGLCDMNHPHGKWVSKSGIQAGQHRFR